jgi:hypothetical protein
MNGEISLDDMKRVHEFLLIDHWRSEVDAVFLFTADATTSLQRENEGKLIDAPGRAMNEDFINDLNEAYQIVMEEYGGQFDRVIAIDTSADSQSTPLSTAVSVTNQILQLF